MTQPTLFAAAEPPKRPGIDLLWGDCGAGMAALPDGCVDLAIFDPPWSQYDAPAAGANPGTVYEVLSEADIGAHLSDGVRLLRPGGRLVMWACWPLLVETFRGSPPSWLAIDGLRWVTGGSWHKSGRLGVGYHWRGHSEPVLVGAKIGQPTGPALINLRSSYTSQKADHSAKPAEWMADWIRAWVPPGGCVLEPYAGLGSGAVATVLAGEGRRYVGYEVDEERYRAARMNVLRASS